MTEQMPPSIIFFQVMRVEHQRDLFLIVWLVVNLQNHFVGDGFIQRWQVLNISQDAIKACAYYLFSLLSLSFHIQQILAILEEVLQP